VDGTPGVAEKFQPGLSGAWESAAEDRPDASPGGHQGPDPRHDREKSLAPDPGRNGHATEHDRQDQRNRRHPEPLDEWPTRE